MKNLKTKITTQLTLGLLLGAGPAAFAGNITIFDGRSSGPNYWGAPGIGQGREDQETEAGTLPGQNWDLEAFYLQGNKLSVIGGFPMLTANPGEMDFKLGDIFIDINGGFLGSAHPYQNPISNILHNDAGEIVPVPSTPGGAFGKVSNADFGYEYVIHFTRNSASVDPLETINGFQVIKIDNNSSLTAIGYAHGAYNSYGFDGDRSNPYQYSSGGIVDNSASGSLGGKLSIVSGLSDGGISSTYGIDVTGGTHNVLTLDLPSYLFAGLVNIHETLGCGNDNMAGYHVPEGGATAMLLGLGMISLGAIKRKR